MLTVAVATDDQVRLHLGNPGFERRAVSLVVLVRDYACSVLPGDLGRSVDRAVVDDDDFPAARRPAEGLQDSAQGAGLVVRRDQDGVLGYQLVLLAGGLRATAY